MDVFLLRAINKLSTCFIGAGLIILSFVFMFTRANTGETVALVVVTGLIGYILVLVSGFLPMSWKSSDQSWDFGRGRPHS
jgi:hypothetical protein